MGPIIRSSTCGILLITRNFCIGSERIDLIMRQLGHDTNLGVSAHILRHTSLTDLVRRGNDLVLVAEIVGHKRLETTRWYSLPAVEDRETAMEGLRIDY